MVFISLRDRDILLRLCTDLAERPGSAIAQQNLLRQSPLAGLFLHGVALILRCATVSRSRGSTRSWRHGWSAAPVVPAPALRHPAAGIVAAAR